MATCRKTDSPNIRIPSIIYASHVMTTMVPILTEVVYGYPDLPDAQRTMILGAYVPYFIVPGLLLLRMTVFWRSTDKVKAKAKKE
ncbi:hypothetical protein HK101_010704 [Irineochytrium annulatum]|nr:hypothetical protein HK101_010704 [Irineochytrium annulatum]